MPMDHARIQQIVADHELPKFRLQQLQNAFFRQQAESFQDITTLSKTLRAELAAGRPVFTVVPKTVQSDGDGTAYKALLELSDGCRIETVLMQPKPGLWTACISSQVGCALGCRFCATGALGFTRNLTSEEITDQVLFWRNFLQREWNRTPLNNVVYMGMGEPFQNVANVFASLDELMNPDTFGIGARHISVSTIGLVAQIPKFAARFPQVNLAVSLHTADQATREELLPVGQANALPRLAQALTDYLAATRRKLFIECILLRGVNDRPADADRLSDYLKRINPVNLVHVNLIRYNETNGRFQAPARETTRKFQQRLRDKGIKSTIRKSLGREIDAACGQLAGRSGS